MSRGASPQVRELVIDRDGGRCVWCNKPLDEWDATVDHVIPLSDGGHRNKSHNLVAACNRCNTRRGTRSPVEFAYIIGKTPKKAAVILDRVITSIALGSMSPIAITNPSCHWTDTNKGWWNR